MRMDKDATGKLIADNELHLLLIQLAGMETYVFAILLS